MCEEAEREQRVGAMGDAPWLRGAWQLPRMGFRHIAGNRLISSAFPRPLSQVMPQVAMSRCLLPCSYLLPVANIIVP